MRPRPKRPDQTHKAVKAVSLAALMFVFAATGLPAGTSVANAAGLGKLVIRAGSPETDPGKSGQVLSIFNNKCSNCHSGNSRKGGMGFITDLDRLGGAAKYINRCNAKASLLWKKIDGDTDQKGHNSLTEKEKSQLATWIKAQNPDASEDEERQSVSQLAVYRTIQEDLAAVGEKERKQLRYLSLVNLFNAGEAIEQVEQYHAGLVKLVEAFSSRPGKEPVTTIGNNMLILRLDLGELGWSAQKWEALTRFSPYQIYPDDITYDFIRQDTGANIPLLRGDWFAYASSNQLIADFLMNLPADISEQNICLNGGSGTESGAERKDNLHFIRSLSASSAASASKMSDWTFARRLINRYEKTVCMADAAAEFGISRKGLKWHSETGATKVQLLNAALEQSGVERTRFEEAFVELAGFVNSSSGVEPVGSLRAASAGSSVETAIINKHLQENFPAYGTLGYCRNPNAAAAGTTGTTELLSVNGYYLTYATAPYYNASRAAIGDADNLDIGEALQVAKTLARAKIVLNAATSGDRSSSSKSRPKDAKDGEISRINNLNDAVSYLEVLNAGFPFDEQWQSEQNNTDITVKLRARLRNSSSPAQRIIAEIAPQVLSDQQSLTIRIKGLLDSAVAIYAWQADDSVVRLYPQSDDEVLGIKAGKFYQLPQSGDHINDLKVRPMSGSQGNHEAIVVLASGSLQDISSLAPGIGASAGANAATTTSEFLDRISKLPVGSYQLSFRPYQVLASD